MLCYNKITRNDPEISIKGTQKLSSYWDKYDQLNGNISKIEIVNNYKCKMSENLGYMQKHGYISTSLNKLNHLVKVILSQRSGYILIVG